MKKIISVLILTSILVSFALVPVHAAENRGENSPYCFYYEYDTPNDAYFCNQFFIEHTGQTFHTGSTFGNIFTTKTVTTNDDLYMNLLFGAKYNVGASSRVRVVHMGYLIGNHNYFYDMDPEYKYNFDETKVTEYVKASTSISIYKYNGFSTQNSTYGCYNYIPTIPRGYTSLITGKTYIHTFDKTLSQIFEHGLDYLDELN